VNLANGKIIWQTYTTPDNGNTIGGFSGVSVWGSSPSIDPDSKVAYYTTGQLGLSFSASTSLVLRFGVQALP
jgi:hypothetical protein